MIGNASTPPIEGYAPPPAATPVEALGFAIGLFYFGGIAMWLQPSMIPDKLKSAFGMGKIEPMAIVYGLGLATPPLLLLYFLSRKN